MESKLRCTMQVYPTQSGKIVVIAGRSSRASYLDRRYTHRVPDECQAVYEAERKWCGYVEYK